MNDVASKYGFQNSCILDQGYFQELMGIEPTKKGIRYCWI